MANHSLPTLTSTYTNFLTEVSGRIDDAIRQSRSDTASITSPSVTVTNLPVGAIRWEATNKKWQANTGTVASPVWSDLATTYGISISGSAGSVVGTVSASDGTVTAPSIYFGSDTDTGLYKAGTNTVGIAAGGVSAATFDASGNINLSGGIGVRAGTPSASASAVISYTLGHGNTTRYGVDNRITIDNTTGALTGDRATYAAYNLVESQVQNAVAFSHIAYGSYNAARTGTAGGSSTTAEGVLYGSYNLGQNQSADGSYNRTVSVCGSYNYGLASGVTAYVDNLYGSYNVAQATGAGSNVVNAFGVYSQVRPTNSLAAIQNTYLYYGTNSTITGGVVANWGVYIASAINNYFAGGIQVGGTATGTDTVQGLGVGTLPTGAGKIDATGDITTTADFIGATLTATGTVTGATFTSTGTGAMKLPAGTTAQRPTAATGQLRYNTTIGKFEGYNGSAWGAVGGGATGGGSDAIFHENDQAVTTNYTVPSGKNAMSAGPITINSGITVTVSSGSVWTVV